MARTRRLYSLSTMVEVVFNSEMLMSAPKLPV